MNKKQCKTCVANGTKECIDFKFLKPPEYDCYGYKKKDSFFNKLMILLNWR